MRIEQYLQTMNKLIQTLLRHSLSLQTIESFTGGSLAHHFIKHAGASQWFKQGLILYHEEAKAKFLGITKESLRKIDPVSESLVKLCLKQANKVFPQTISIMTTGNAGPTKQGNRDVGDFFIGVSDGNNTLIQKGHVEGSRIKIQQAGVKLAIQLLSEFLSTYYSVSTK